MSSSTNANNKNIDTKNAQSVFVPKSDNEYYKHFGGRNKFMVSYGLKPWEDDDVEEGKTILNAFRKQDKYEWEQEQASKNRKWWYSTCLCEGTHVPFVANMSLFYPRPYRHNQMMFFDQRFGRDRLGHWQSTDGSHRVRLVTFFWTRSRNIVINWPFLWWVTCAGRNDQAYFRINMTACRWGKFEFDEVIECRTPEVSSKIRSQIPKLYRLPCILDADAS